MRCVKCQTENPEGAKFCEECGSKLIAACPQCGHQVSPTAKFCAECGTSLSTKAQPVVSPQPPASYTPPHLAERIRATSVTDGERKTITALFADLKGSTALIEGLDPEEARAIIDPALEVMMDAVHQYDGYVAQALGDGIFALFGAPLAHEDHPQRALSAALRMQEALRRYADTLRGKGYPPLLMRVGLNTGEVVVRSIRKDDLHADYVPVGHSTNLAARMEQLAAPGSIVVSSYTHRLTDGYFAFKDLGEAQIKGVEESLRVYEVLGAGPLRTRLQVAARRGLTRFVGRHSEMEQMQQALQQAKAGHGQIVGVMGEPGLGKSRLFYEFKLLAQAGSLVLEAYSVSHGKASPYLPVIELLKSYFDIQPQDDERKRREKVTGKVLSLDRSLEDSLPYLFGLLGIPDATTSIQQMDPQIRRRRTFESLKKLFLRESLNQPLILIFEDLHWIDSETQGFLDTLSEGIASAKILLLVNYRPEYRHEWGQKTYYTQLRLAPFGRAEAEEFLAVLLGTSGHLNVLKQLILEKTEGTPFFMEEIVQELDEQGVIARDGAGIRVQSAPTMTTLTDLHIPTTVQGVLAARIDRLAPEEKTLLQQLAVIGREFPVSLLRRVIPQAEEEVYRLLAALQRKEFLYEQPAFPEVEYIFKHALTQEVAYGTVLQEQRKVLHDQTAQAIEHLYHDRLDERYSELAHHYSRSSNTQKAVDYLQLAGQRAMQRSANIEAMSHFTHAMELLKRLPDTRSRAQQELILQVSLSQTLMALRGWTAPEVGRAYTRARELCQEVGDTTQLASVLGGLWGFYVVRGELHTAKELGEQLLTLAQEQQHPLLLRAGYFEIGFTRLFMGQSSAARTALEYGRTIANLDPLASDALTYGYDTAVMCLSFTASSLWQLGYPDQARRSMDEALALTNQLSHSYTLAIALGRAALFYDLCRERQLAHAQATAAVSVCTDQGFSYWFLFASIIEKQTRNGLNHEAETLRSLRTEIAAYRGMGARLLCPYFLSLLAETSSEVGQPEEGLIAVDEALELSRTTEEYWNQPELYRLKGELTLQNPSVISSQLSVSNTQAEAEECFLKAIESARKQHAKSLELRATMSLARLWQQQGKNAEGHRLLSDIYKWFTEGFDTKDLQDAKALLAELGAER